MNFVALRLSDKACSHVPQSMKYRPQASIPSTLGYSSLAQSLHHTLSNQSMTFTGLNGPASPTTPTRTHFQLEEYDSSSSNDTPDATRMSSYSQPRSRAPFATLHSSTGPDFLFPPQRISGRSSVSSTASSTPIPSRSASPLPPFLSSSPPSSCTSDTESEPNSPLIRGSRNQWWREDRRRWWMIGSSMRRRRRRDWTITRFLKKWTRKIIRHPFFPKQPITIVCYTLHEL